MGDHGRRVRYPGTFLSDRLAVFGGRFDPFHNLHLEIVRQAIAVLPVEHVALIPNGSPAHRDVVASWSHRLAMARLGCAGLDAAKVLELEPTGQEGRTYATLARLPAHTGTPVLIVGSDAFAALDSWWRWQDLLAAVNWAVMPRTAADWRPSQPELARYVAANQVGDSAQLASGAGKVWSWPAALGHISASDIRRSIAGGDDNWRQLTPAAVAEYICAYGLYGKAQSKECS